MNKGMVVEKKKRIPIFIQNAGSFSKLLSEGVFKICQKYRMGGINRNIDCAKNVS